MLRLLTTWKEVLTAKIGKNLNLNNNVLVVNAQSTTTNYMGLPVLLCQGSKLFHGEKTGKIIESLLLLFRKKNLPAETFDLMLSVLLSLFWHFVDWQR